MADNFEIWLEAERRGILPPEQQGLLEEARLRGLISGVDEPEAPSPSTAPPEAPIVPPRPDLGVNRGIPVPPESPEAARPGMGPIAEPEMMGMPYESDVPRGTSFEPIPSVRETEIKPLTKEATKSLVSDLVAGYVADASTASRYAPRGLEGPEKPERSVLETLTQPFKAQTYKAAEAFNAGVGHFSSNLDALARYMEKKGIGTRGGMFEDAAKKYYENADYWKKRADKVGVNVIDEIVGGAVGGAFPGITEFIMGVPYAASLGAASANEKEESELKGAFVEGAKRALLGQIFKGAGELKQPYRSATMGGVFGVHTAIEGGDTEEIAKSVGTGALFGMVGRGRVGPGKIDPALVQRAKDFLKYKKVEKLITHEELINGLTGRTSVRPEVDTFIRTLTAKERVSLIKAGEGATITEKVPRWTKEPKKEEAIITEPTIETAPGEAPLVKAEPVKAEPKAKPETPTPVAKARPEPEPINYDKRMAVKLTPSQKQTITEIREQVDAGEAGYRARTEDPTAERGKDITYVGVPSTFPKYFKNKGYGKKETLMALDKALKGIPLGPGQRLIIEDLNRDYRHTLAREVKKDRKDTEIIAGNLKEGDVFKIKGEKHTVTKTEEAAFLDKVTIENGKKIKIPGEERIKIDRGTLEKDAVEKVEPIAEPSVVSGTLPKPYDPLKGEKGEVAIDLPKGKLTKAWKSFKEFWMPTSTLPEGKEYLSARYKALGDVDRVEGTVQRIWRRTKDLEPSKKKALFDFLDGKIKAGDLPPDVFSLGQALKSSNNLIGKMLVKRGILDKKTFEAHKGKYIRYVYLKHILGEGKMGGVARGGKLDLNYLKKRQDLTREQQKAIGLVEDVSIAEPLGVSAALSDVAKFDFMEKISTNPKWVWDASIVKVDGRRMGIGRLAEEVDIARKMLRQAPEVPEIKSRLAKLEAKLEEAMEKTKNVPEDFMQLPTTKTYGPMAGAFIRKEIAKDIMPVIDTFSEAGSVSKMVNAAITLEKKAMAAFKIGKVALNLPTVTRNIISNQVQLNLSGIPLHKLPFYWGKAATAAYYHVAKGYKGKLPKELADVVPEGASSKYNRYFVEARRNGIFRTNWAITEIAEVLDTVKTMQKAGPLEVFTHLKNFARYYGKIDDFFKLVKFIERRENGASVKDATLEAQKWVMDYSLTDPSIKMARRHIMPMVSYQYKIIPLLSEAATKRPWAFLKYPLFFYLFQEYSKQELDLDEEEWKKLQRDLPFYIRKTGSYVLMPYRSPEGDVQWVNLEYFVPWQSMVAVGQDITEKKYGELLGDVGVGNPLLDIYTVGKTMRNEDPPKDPFTGRDIYNRLHTPTEKALLTSEWLYSKWAPSMLTRYGALGYTLNIGEKDRYGRTISKSQAAGRWFGFNIVAPTKKQVKLEKYARKKELEASLMRLLRDPTITDEEKAKRKAEYKRQIDELKAEYE